MRARPLLCACAVLLLTGRLIQAQSLPSGVDIDAVVGRATRYVNEFASRFSNVVAEETYVQETVSQPRPGASINPRSGISSAGSGVGTRRLLRSDFLMVKPARSDEYLPFRDVFEVDGSRVRDREQRLAKLFLESSTTAVEQANQIASESSRYNLGNVTRTINNPVLALAFLQAHHHTRVRYRPLKPDASAGANVWIVEYREQARPTLIKGRRDKDMPAQGRYWIDIESGRIARSELSLLDSAVSARVTVDFEHDDRFDIDVPVKMSETYLLSNGSQVLGTATYGRFRRFDVSTEETLDPQVDDPR